MRFLRSHEAPFAPALAEAAGVASEPYESVDEHYAFIDKHEKELNFSAKSWGEITHGTKELSSTYIEQVSSQGNNCDTPEVVNLSKRQASELTSYARLAIRSCSAGDMSVKKRQEGIGDMWLNAADPAIRTMLTNKHFKVYRFITDQFKLSDHMYVIDKLNQPILTDFSAHYLDSSPRLEELASLFDNGIAEDRLFGELRRIIATDWYHPDPESSILRSRLSELRSEPGLFVRDFGRMAVTAETNDRYEPLRVLARYVLRHNHEPIDADRMTDALVSTSEYWNDFKEFKLFGGYVDDRIRQTQHLIEQIVGPKQQHGLRIIPSMQDAQRAKTRIPQSAPTTANRAARRRNQQSTPVYTVPDYNEDAGTVQETSPTRELKLIKTRQDGSGQDLSDLVDVNLEDIARQFKVSPQLAQDITGMIGHLRDNPFGRGTYVLSGKYPKLRIGGLEGKSYPLRLFAPGRATGLRINSENRQTIIIYAITQTALGLLDVTNRQDKTWID